MAEVAFHDFYYDPQEKLEVVGRDALISEVIILLTSSLGDFVGDLERGGFFDTALREYPLEESSSSEVAAFLASNIERSAPHIKVIALRATPLLNRRAWHLDLQVMDVDTKIRAEFSHEFGVAK